MGGVADEQSIGCGHAQKGERPLHGLGVRLVPDAAVAADDGRDEAVQPDVQEGLFSQPVGLARHQGHPVARVGEPFHRLDDPLVRPDQPVVVLQLIGAEPLEELVGLRVIPGVFAEDGQQRPPDVRAPLLVRGHPAAEADEGVARRAEDELEGIDEGAVEVEEDGGEHVPN